MQGEVIHNPKTKPSYIHKLQDADMAFCTNMRASDVDMYVTNRLDWGHLITAENFETTHFNNELYEIVNNRWDWEKRYLHVNYSEGLDTAKEVLMVRSTNFQIVRQLKYFLLQPCPDVYWFPILTERFCDELVGEMENFGKWSDGTNTVSALVQGVDSEISIPAAHAT